MRTEDIKVGHIYEGPAIGQDKHHVQREVTYMDAEVVSMRVPLQYSAQLWTIPIAKFAAWAQKDIGPIVDKRQS